MPKEEKKGDEKPTSDQDSSQAPEKIEAPITI